MLLPQKSSSNFVSEINLEVFNINFSLCLPLLPFQVCFLTKLTKRMESHQEQGECWHQTHSQDRFPHLQTKLQHSCYCLNMYNAATWFRLASTCCNKFSRNIFWLKPINTWKMGGEWKVGVSEALVPSSQQKTWPKPRASCCHGLSAQYPPSQNPDRPVHSPWAQAPH